MSLVGEANRTVIQIRASIRKFLMGKRTVMKAANLYDLSWDMGFDLTQYSNELADAETRNKITPRQRAELYGRREAKYRNCFEEQFIQMDYGEQIIFYASYKDAGLDFINHQWLMDTLTPEQLTAARLLL